MDTPSSDTPENEIDHARVVVREEQGPADWREHPKSDDKLTPQTRERLGLTKKRGDG